MTVEPVTRNPHPCTVSPVPGVRLVAWPPTGAAARWDVWLYHGSRLAARLSAPAVWSRDRVIAQASRALVQLVEAPASEEYPCNADAIPF